MGTKRSVHLLGLHFLPLTVSLGFQLIRHILAKECYSAIKRNEIMPFVATWMDLEIIILSKVSQKEKDKCHDICGI